MMNLLARILSHGFAFAVVALIVLVLMYRGEFPLWDIPESLAIKGMPSASQVGGSGNVERTAEDAKHPAEATAVVPLETPETPPALATATDTREVAQPDVEVPAADTKSPAEAANGTVAERQVETSPAEAEEGSDTTGTAINGQPVEEYEETSATSTPGSDDSSVQGTDEVSAEMTREISTDTGGIATDESAITAELVSVPIDADSGADKELQTPDDTPMVPDDAAAGTATMMEAAAVSVPEEADPAETTLIAVEQADTSQAATEESATTANSITAVEPLAAPLGDEAQLPVDNAVSGTPYETMAKAREAFWLRDFELAEKQYRILIQLEPDNPDGYGEMGNMYFSQGKWEEAAAAYYQAGARLLSDGLVEQARQMVDVIRGLNGPQADDLEAQINAASM